MDDRRSSNKDMDRLRSQMKETDHLLYPLESSGHSDASTEEDDNSATCRHRNFDTYSQTSVSHLGEEHYTIHAQTLILSIAFLFVWSPQNLMAPNLTQMGEYFHFNSDQRDLFLGSNIAFATGVLSLPVSAFIGFLADVMTSRKKLYAGTVLCGGVSSILTGASTTYTQLYTARFICGACMSGSVPVAFSLLGDLFEAKDRNAASSGLTAMMGAGIIFGQVYSGAVGDSMGWKHPFYVSGICTILSSLLVLRTVKEPNRGGKEKVLQDLVAKGTKYDRKLSFKGFIAAMTKNSSNIILMIQGLLSNIPWGIILTFFNDYLSQEQNLSVPQATYIVALFGVGSAIGAIYGGIIGAKLYAKDRRLLPFFMSLSTFVGTFPFLGFLDIPISGIRFLVSLSAIVAGIIINLQSVNVRPCLINVNPPETRGATLTAANLLINLGRGIGPSTITMGKSIWGLSRQFSFNLSLIIFNTLSSVLLIILMFTLPNDQDAMDAELEQYAKKMVDKAQNDYSSTTSYQSDYDDSESIISIEERMTSFDDQAALESIQFLGDAFREIGEELSHFGNPNQGNKSRRSICSDQRRLYHQQHYRDNANNFDNDDGNYERGPLIDYERGTRQNTLSYGSHSLL